MRDTVAAVRERQPDPEAGARARAEADHLASAVAREHARLVAEHQEAARRPGPRRKPESPPPSWEEAVRAVVERYLLELRRVFEEACAWVREQLQARRSVDRDAPAGVESGPPAPEPSPRSSGRARDVPEPGAGDGRTRGEASRPPAAPPAPVAVPHEERVRRATDAAEAGLPRAKPAPGNPMLQPLAVSDGTLDRLAASTEDRFVRDTVVAVRQRQFPYHAYYRARAEEDHHAPAGGIQEAVDALDPGNVDQFLTGEALDARIEQITEVPQGKSWWHRVTQAIGERRPPKTTKIGAMADAWRGAGFHRRTPLALSSHSYSFFRTCPKSASVARRAGR